jgi:hypothetical protein
VGASGHDAAAAAAGIHGWIIEPDQQEEMSPIGTVGTAAASCLPTNQHSAEKMSNGLPSYTAAGDATLQLSTSLGRLGPSDTVAAAVRATMSSRIWWA